MAEGALYVDCGTHGKRKSATVCGHFVRNNGQPLGFIENSSDPDDLQAWCYACEYVFSQEEKMTDYFKKFNDMAVVCVDCYQKYKVQHTVDGKPLLARNHEWVEEDSEYLTICKTKPDNKLESLGFTFQGNETSRYGGINKEGLAISGASASFANPGIGIILNWCSQYP